VKIKEVGLAVRVSGPTCSVTGMTSGVGVPDVGVTVTAPSYVPPGTPRGAIVTVSVAVVKPELAVALNQFPPPAVLAATEKPIEESPTLESWMVWEVGPGTSKVNDVSEGMIDRVLPILNVIGICNVVNPAAATLMVAVYMPGSLASWLNVVML
jgi:hypothetical protein